jgi:hypothetical protein
MKKPQPLKKLSPAWTCEDRLRVVAAILPGMQEDIYADRYSAPGRPNVTSLMHILHDDAAALEEVREHLEAVVALYEDERSHAE